MFKDQTSAARDNDTPSRGPEFEKTLTHQPGHVSDSDVLFYSIDVFCEQVPVIYIPDERSGRPEQAKCVSKVWIVGCRPAELQDPVDEERIVDQLDDKMCNSRRVQKLGAL